MNVKDKRIFAIALVLMALISIFVPAASAAVGSQTWYICDAGRTLDKSGAGTGTYSLGAGDANWKMWKAGPPQCELTMGAGTWTLYLDCTATTSGKINAEVWNEKVYPPTTILAGVYSTSEVNVASGDNTLTVPMNDPSGIEADFDPTDPDDCLVLLLGWYPDSGSSALQINYGSDSKLTSPTTDPGYPVPELSTLALYSVGLLALAGYVVYRRRRI